ncbi:MAG: sulfatase-like hydrolase/transferase [Bacteroidales bacterium]|nr:sulfatase-like hydrolase/transferase [Bacteroidales bacterium]MCF8389354.1 sulfatase-like hydrolase/transferase [Bacteroidales bacterium]
MKRQIPYKAILCTLSAGMMAGTLHAGDDTQNIKWNVLVLMTDMQNVHYLGCDYQSTENILTPNLDRIGKEGMIFRKAYDAVPVCAPTRASLLTGTYPMKHGQLANEKLLIEAGPEGKTPSLANLFRDNGYNTAMLGKQHSNLEPLESLPNGTFMGKNIFHGWDFRRYSTTGYESRVEQNRTPDYAPTDDENILAIARAQQMSDEMTQLKEEYENRYPEKIKGTPMPEWEKDIVKENRKYTCNGRGTDHAAQIPDGVFTFETLDYLEVYSGKRKDEKFGLDPNKPFFLFLSLHKPHYDWRAPIIEDGTEWWYMYSARPEEDKLTYLHNGKPEPRIIPNPITKDLLYEDPSSPYFGTRDPYAPDAERFARAKYSANISWLDHMFGKVLDKLAELDDPNNPGKKLSETTIVCFTTDHGDMMGEKKRISKMVSYEGSARVPFLIRMPGIIEPGQQSDILINHVDMFPTLAGLVGLGDQLNSNLDGKDLSKALLANDSQQGPERTFTVAGAKIGALPNEIYSRTQQYKFTRVHGNAKRPSDNLPVMMLFDMDNDPYETNNLAYDPEYLDVVIAENNACNEFLAKFDNIEPVPLTAEMLKGKKKEMLVRPATARGKNGDEDDE